MSAKIIDGKAVAARVRGEVAERGRGVRRTTIGRAPGLATVLVGEDPRLRGLRGGKQRACAEVGMVPFDLRLPADASAEQRRRGAATASTRDPAVSGILLQLPRARRISTARR